MALPASVVVGCGGGRNGPAEVVGAPKTMVLIQANVSLQRFVQPLFRPFHDMMLAMLMLYLLAIVAHESPCATKWKLLQLSTIPL